MTNFDRFTLLAVILGAAGCGSSETGAGGASSSTAGGPVTSTATGPGSTTTTATAATTGAGGGGGSMALPLGTVADSGTVDCATISGGDSLPSGGIATCHGLTVTCPNADPIDAYVAVIEPPITPIGTIYLHNGSSGMSFFDHPVASRYLAAGYRLVDVKWTAEWEIVEGGPTGIKAGACRPATVMKWAFDTPHGGTHDAPFCAQGHSAGSGVISYALANYGMEEYLDYALLTQGPPFGQMNCGCDPTSAGCDQIPPLCPLIPNPALQLPGHVAQWDGVSQCAPGAPAADLAKLAADSVAADDGDFDYPKTGMSAWFCAMNPNGTTGGGAFYLARVTAAGGAAPEVQCSPNCAVEQIYNADATLADGTTLVSDQMFAEMTAGCIPRHQ